MLQFALNIALHDVTACFAFRNEWILGGHAASLDAHVKASCVQEEHEQVVSPGITKPV